MVVEGQLKAIGVVTCAFDDAGLSPVVGSTEYEKVADAPAVRGAIVLTTVKESPTRAIAATTTRTRTVLRLSRERED